MEGVVETAIQWSGRGASVSLFVVTRSADAPRVAMTHGASVPSVVRHYDLLDEEAVLGGRYVHEFDAELGVVPDDLEAYLSACLREAIEVGGQVAWLGFEGSFDFFHLLSDDIATEIYGVGDREGVAVVLSDEEIRSDDWRNRVRSARSNLGVDESADDVESRRHAEDE